jgi:rhodanese-related sulfurtransferase
MSAVFEESSIHPLLEQARREAGAAGLTFSGELKPEDAWHIAQSGAAILVDVRSAEELRFVGHVPGSVHVAWASGVSLTRNPRFARELESKVGKDKPILLLCRSAKRSARAAEAAVKAGFRHAFNVLEGFEGELDAKGHRGGQDGWRFRGLPWAQD